MSSIVQAVPTIQNSRFAKPIFEQNFRLGLATVLTVASPNLEFLKYVALDISAKLYVKHLTKIPFLRVAHPTVRFFHNTESQRLKL